MSFEEGFRDQDLTALDTSARVGIQRLVDNVIWVPTPEILSGRSNVIAMGIDLCFIPDMEEVLADSPGFMTAVFDPSESVYSMTQVRPAASLAARFAAKEAGLKACGFRYREFVIVHEVGKNPSVRLEGGAKEHAGKLGVGAHLLSLSSHGGDYAMAMYIALKLTS